MNGWNNYTVIEGLEGYSKMTGDRICATLVRHKNKWKLITDITFSRKVNCTVNKTSYYDLIDKPLSAELAVEEADKIIKDHVTDMINNLSEMIEGS